MSEWAEVHVSDHLFGVFDEHPAPLEIPEWSTGLIAPLSVGG